MTAFPVIVVCARKSGYASRGFSRSTVTRVAPHVPNVGAVHHATSSQRGSLAMLFPLGMPLTLLVGVYLYVASILQGLTLSVIKKSS